MVEQCVAEIAIDFILKQYGNKNVSLVFFKGDNVPDISLNDEFSIHKNDYYILIQNMSGKRKLINITGDQFDSIVLKIVLNLEEE